MNQMSNPLMNKMNNRPENVDSSHVLETIDKWPSTRAKEWVENFVPRLCKQPDIWTIVIFGSVIRQNAKYSLDVDLLIIYENDRPSFANPPLDVDIRSYRREDIESLIQEGHEVLGWTIRFGKVLYEKDQYWTTLCDKWKNHLPLPSARVADKRAERAKQLFEDIKLIGDEDAAEEQFIAMLTQMARACLIRSGIYPASRPELPDQLRSVGKYSLASQLEDVLQKPRELKV
jgi:predicted nucleotidyltransferase